MRTRAADPGDPAALIVSRFSLATAPAGSRARCSSNGVAAWNTTSPFNATDRVLTGDGHGSLPAASRQPFSTTNTYRTPDLATPPKLAVVAPLPSAPTRTASSTTTSRRSEVAAGTAGSDPCAAADPGTTTAAAIATSVPSSCLLSMREGWPLTRVPGCGSR